MALDPAATILQRQVTVTAPNAGGQGGSFTFTGTIVGNVLNVTVAPTAPNQVVAGLQLSGAGLPGGLFIVQGAQGILAAQTPGNIGVVGGGTPTGSGNGGVVPPSAPNTGVVTGISGALVPNSGSTGNQALTGNGGVGTYLLNQAAAFASGTLTAAFAQQNTGPAVPVNSNPSAGALPAASGAATATAPINPGAVGYAVQAAPYSPGASYAAVVNNNVSGVNNPAVARPANDVAQIDLGASVIGVGMRQGSMSDTGMAT